jgi:eukaryotic-like serine/threonine-protein kinase
VAKAKTVSRFAWLPSTSAAVGVLLLGLFVAPGITRWVENTVYDHMLRARDNPPPVDLVIAAIDEASVERLGPLPWQHNIHAQFITKLHDAGAPLVAFTMPFGEAQNNSGVEQLKAAINLLQSDELANSTQAAQLKKLLDSSVADFDQSATLAKAIQSHGNVVLPVEARLAGSDAEADVLAASADEKLTSIANDKTFIAGDAELVDGAPVPSELYVPPPLFTNPARTIGHVAFETDRDGILRSDTAAIRVGNRLLPSLSVVVAAAMQGVESPQITIDDDALLGFGKKRFQLDDQLRWNPQFFPSTGSNAIKQISYFQVLSGEIDSTQLKGKTVLVGAAGSVANGKLLTPIGGELAPVVAIASSVSSLRLSQTYRYPAWAPILEVLIALVIVALAVTVYPKVSLTTASIITLITIVALVLIEISLLNFGGVWLKLMLPALAALGAASGIGIKSLIRRARTPRGQGVDGVESLRMLGLTFQGQGQLDLAYETFRRCPNDTQSMDLLYLLGQDYERRRQFNKAGEVYTHLASVDINYKDIVQRRDRMKRADIAQSAAATPIPKATTRHVHGHEPSMVPIAERQTSGKQSLGRYEIERELGKGAMGVVYLGRDPKINRVVAIKAIALAEEFADDDLADARARFFREAEMAGRLNHPGIVTVYDAGEDRGLAYIAMEYLRGEHLSHYAEPIHLLPIARVLSLIARVADALDYAHKQNVVHRDIKPANIMFNKDTDELKLTDFGIARLTDTSRTKTGIVLGTPSFMSPEQLEGRPLDGRSDLFGLGITLYQLLTGQLPFRADSMTRLMQKIATEEHVPLRSLRPELPEMAEQIVSRALAKSAVDRYQTGAEMATALRTCLRLASRKEAIAR